MKVEGVLERQVFTAVREVGTPAYCFSSARVEQAVRRWRRFTESLPLPAETFYSVKTNYLPQLLWQLSNAGIGAEVTSLREWQLARAIHPAGAIVVNGVGKTAGLLQAVLDGDEPPRLVNVETDTEIDVLAAAAPAWRVPVGLRVRIPSLSGQNGSDPSEGWARGAGKFGWPTTGQAVIDAAKQLGSLSHVDLAAVHLHLGGQIVAADVYDCAVSGLCGLLERLDGAGVRVRTLDLGGGLASGWVAKRRTGPLADLAIAAGLDVATKVQQEPDLAGIARVIDHFAPLLRAYGIENIVLEPGRILAEPAMLAVASVIAIRHEDDRDVAVVDIGTNALHCWRGNETRPLHYDNLPDANPHRYDLYGPLCHRSDRFGTIQTPGTLQPGSLIAFDAVGAYSLGDWIANAWDRPAVLDLDDGAILSPAAAPSEIFTTEFSPEYQP
jgi:diaminopimelate decarboxylase